jgi:hypothetical protein
MWGKKEMDPKSFVLLSLCMTILLGIQFLLGMSNVSNVVSRFEDRKDFSKDSVYWTEIVLVTLLLLTISCVGASLLIYSRVEVTPKRKDLLVFIDTENKPEDRESVKEVLNRLDKLYKFENINLKTVWVDRGVFRGLNSLSKLQEFCKAQKFRGEALGRFSHIPLVRRDIPITSWMNQREWSKKYKVAVLSDDPRMYERFRPLVVDVNRSSDRILKALKTTLKPEEYVEVASASVALFFFYQRIENLVVNKDPIFKQLERAFGVE